MTSAMRSAKVRLLAPVVFSTHIKHVVSSSCTPHMRSVVLIPENNIVNDVLRTEPSTSETKHALCCCGHQNKFSNRPGTSAAMVCSTGRGKEGGFASEPSLLDQEKTPSRAACSYYHRGSACDVDIPAQIVT